MLPKLAWHRLFSTGDNVDTDPPSDTGGTSISSFPGTGPHLWQHCLQRHPCFPQTPEFNSRFWRGECSSGYGYRPLCFWVSSLSFRPPQPMVLSCFPVYPSSPPTLQLLSPLLLLSTHLLAPASFFFLYSVRPTPTACPPPSCPLGPAPSACPHSLASASSPPLLLSTFWLLQYSLPYFSSLCIPVRLHPPPLPL
ncbi:unnamed protein product [Eretmochelys imbricata]